MVSKWSQLKNVSEYDSGGGIDPIPDKTVVQGVIEHVQHCRYQDDPNEPLVVELRFRVSEPLVYKNKVIYLKLRINDPDEAKAMKASAAYAAIDNQMASYYISEEQPISIVEHLIKEEAKGVSYEKAIDDETLTKAWAGKGDQMLTLRLGLTKKKEDGRQYQWLMQVMSVDTEARQTGTTVKSEKSSLGNEASFPKVPVTNGYGQGQYGVDHNNLPF